MSLALPAIARLYEMADLVTAMLAYELLAGLVALDQRPFRPGEGVQALHTYIRHTLPPFEQDRSPGPDVEQLLQLFETAEFKTFLSAQPDRL